MADPTTPTTPVDITGQITNTDALTSSLYKQGEASKNLTTNMNNLGATHVNNTSAMFNFAEGLDKLKDKLTTNTQLMEEEVNTLGLLTTAAFGTRNAFNNLVNIDTDRLNTFTQQFENLRNTILANGGTLNQFAGYVSRVLGTAIPDSAKGSASAIIKFAENMLKGADNALRAQNAFLQLSAQTGNLGRVFDLAGPNLENLNELVAQQQHRIQEAASAVNVSAEVMEKYYSELGRIPGALEATITPTQNMAVQMGATASSVDMMAAAVLVAAGSGRSHQAVIEDLNKAYQEYGLVGEPALRFTAQISEAAQQAGVDFNTMHSALTATAHEFTRFADVSGDASARLSSDIKRTMTEYVDQLKKGGMAGVHAVSVVQDMTRAMGNMSIAQKAFLSAQTGGPGGLMGGFQIEKMMREGKFSEVLDKARNELRKQLGPIVSLEEAARSPQAAAQAMRQRLMVQQGPLGELAKTPEDATRLLEAFRAMDEGRKPEEAPEDILGKTMDQGLKVQGQSLSELQIIRQTLLGMDRSANLTALNLIQRGHTAAAGTSRIEGTEYQEGLRRFAGRGLLRGGESTLDTKEAFAEGRMPIDRSAHEKLMHESAADIAKIMPTMMEATKEKIAEGKKIWDDLISSAKKKISLARGPEEKRVLEEELSSMQKKRQDFLDSLKIKKEYGSEVLKGGIEAPRESTTMLAKEPRKVAEVAAPGGAASTVETGTMTNANARPTTEPLEVNVKINALCSKCHREIHDASAQAGSVAVGNNI